VYDLEIAEHGSRELAKIFVVITGYIDDPRPVLGFPQNRPDNIVVFLRPVEILPQTPQVDYVADEIEGVGMNVAEKI
jgi:hypothetical protein